MRSDEHPEALLLRTDGYSKATERLKSGASFSGHERNHVFLNQNGEDYVEISGISGLDHPGDSRAFAVLDYDRDGWQDIAVVNANAPLFQLFRNQMGERGDPGAMVAIRFEGGNRFAAPNSQWSTRDAYGAHVLLEIEGRELRREHRAGEGLAAQNSATMRVGIGDAGEVTRLEVRWPSGRWSDTTAVPAGTLVTAYEDPAASPTGGAVRPCTVPGTRRAPRGRRFRQGPKRVDSGRAKRSFRRTRPSHPLYNGGHMVRPLSRRAA